MERGVPARRDAPVEREELVGRHERLPPVLLPVEVAHLEVPDHPDPPEDGPAVDAMLFHNLVKAPEQVFAVVELCHDEGAVRRAPHVVLTFVVDFILRGSAGIRSRRSISFARSTGWLNTVYTRFGRHASANRRRSSKSAWSLRGNCASRPYERVKS